MAGEYNMLVQSKLDSYGMHPKDALKCLESEHGVMSKFHDDGRVILDYCQFKASPRDKVSRECRGLVLNYNDWSLVARGFSRFLNAGQSQDDDKAFNWNDGVTVTHKEDGTYILYYFHNGEWRVNTRFSYGDMVCNEALGWTWEQLFYAGLGFKYLDTKYTYVFELCSPYNKVVHQYEKPQVYLLSVFDGYNELPWNDTLDIAKESNLQIPKSFTSRRLDDVAGYIADVAKQCPTFEGCVVRDVNNHRLKVKSPMYVSLHRFYCGSTASAISTKNLVPLLLQNELDEVIVYFPELKKYTDDLKRRLNVLKEEVSTVWDKYKGLSSRKEFALAVNANTTYGCLLFQAYTRGGHPLDYLTEEYLIKVL